MVAPSVIYGDVDLKATPGPGAYETTGGFESDVVFRTSVGTLVSPRSPSSMFINGEMVDRFGRPLKGSPQIAPGPGSYDVVLRSSEQARRGGARSVFNSTSSRSAGPGELAVGTAHFKPPGPAFYSPNLSLGSKKSFHLNAKKRWL